MSQATFEIVSWQQTSKTVVRLCIHYVYIVVVHRCCMPLVTMKSDPKFDLQCYHPYYEPYPYRVDRSRISALVAVDRVTGLEYCT